MAEEQAELALEVEEAPAEEEEAGLRDALEDAFESDPETETETVSESTEELAEPEVEPQAITPGPKAEPPGQNEAPEARLPIERAPASWREENTSAWSDIPEAARVQILQRERQMDAALRDSSNAKKFSEAVIEKFNPHKAILEAEGATPIQAIESLLQTGAQLRTGSAPELAHLIAGMVTRFGTGRFGNQFVEMLDSALTGQAQGQPMSQPQANVQAMVQQQIAPMQEYVSGLQQREVQAAQEAQAQVDSHVEQFLLTQPHAEELRETMADVVEIGARQGRTLTLEEAYDAAMRMHPQLSQVVIEKAAAEKRAGGTTTARRARANSASVRGAAPRQSADDSNASVRDSIEAALVAHSR